MASNPLLNTRVILHFPNELCYGYLRFEGNGKIPAGRQGKPHSLYWGENGREIGYHKIGMSAQIRQNRIRGGWGVQKLQKTSDIIYVRSLIEMPQIKIVSSTGWCEVKVKFSEQSFTLFFDFQQNFEDNHIKDYYVPMTARAKLAVKTIE